MTMRKVPAMVVLVAGLAMIVLPLAVNSFTTANQAQQLLDGARPIVAPPYLQQEFLAGLQTASQTEQLLTGPGFALLASDLGQTPAQFQAQVAAQWPAIVSAQQQAPAIEAAAQAILSNLERHQHDFQLADAIPVPGFRLVSAIWILLIFGALVVAGASWFLLRPGLAPAVAITALGVVFVVSAFATSLPAKASAAHQVTASLTITPAKNAKILAQFETVSAAFGQVQTQLLPQAAQQLGTDPGTLSSQLDTAVPGLAAGLSQIPLILGHFGGAVRFRENNVSNVPPVRSFPFQALLWTEIALGALAAAGGGLSLAVSRPRRQATQMAASGDHSVDGAGAG
jgi:Bacterial protein of unknown function (DUF937)